MVKFVASEMSYLLYLSLLLQKPLDLILPEGGGLTLATAAFLKDMHSIGKNATLNPGHLFGQVRLLFFSTNTRIHSFIDYLHFIVCLCLFSIVTLIIQCHG